MRFADASPGVIPREGKDDPRSPSSDHAGPFDDSLDEITQQLIEHAKIASTQSTWDYFASPMKQMAGPSRSFGQTLSGWDAADSDVEQGPIRPSNMPGWYPH